MNEASFESFAQNGEDVVLWRALGDLQTGRYIDVGANDPSLYSISRAFYNHGWRGITIEPVDYFAQRQREERPEDLLIEAAITSTPGEPVVLHEIPDSGLSTLIGEVSAAHNQAGWKVRDIVVPTRSLNQVLEQAGWQDFDIHFMTVDVEGAEADVLASIDFTVWRPWILVIEATAPLTTKPTHDEWESKVLEAGYEYCLFDGLSRYYVAREHAERLRPSLDRPANPHDTYTTALVRRLDHAINEVSLHVGLLTEDVIRWRAAALERWAQPTSISVAAAAELDDLRVRVHQLTHDLVSTRATLSWRITKPLRGARRFTGPRRTPS
jgi:FkbM family methyltransferase